MIEVHEAKRILAGEVSVLDPETVSLDDAPDRVLAEPILSDRDLPAADVSTMDGFALRVADVPEPGSVLRVAGEVRAGQSIDGARLGPGEAFRILTGALVPEGADAVVMVELTRDEGSKAVRILERPETGQNIRRRGEDVRGGERILEEGTPVRAAEIAALAAVGRTQVQVVRSPEVRIVSTGDEVVEVGDAPSVHQVRNSNAQALLAQLREMGIRGTYLGIAPDRLAALEEVLRVGLAGDVLLVTGGVSVGTHDLVGDALARTGMRVLFHEVAVRPGKPILAGIAGRCLVLGLPGNPVSTFTCFAVFAAPAIRRMMGYRRAEASEVHAVLRGRLKRRPGRTTFHLARLEARDGTLVADPVRTMGSGDVVSLSRANAFIVTPGGNTAFEPGSTVTVMPWRDFDRC